MFRGRQNCICFSYAAHYHVEDGKLSYRGVALGVICQRRERRRRACILYAASQFRAPKVRREDLSAKEAHSAQALLEINFPRLDAPLEPLTKIERRSVRHTLDIAAVQPWKNARSCDIDIQRSCLFLAERCTALPSCVACISRLLNSRMWKAGRSRGDALK